MSEYATTERLGRLKAWICEMSAACAQLYPDNVKWEQRWYDLQAATDAFAKSISTPIPLTPSDALVSMKMDGSVIMTTEGIYSVTASDTAMRDYLGPVVLRAMEDCTLHSQDCIAHFIAEKVAIALRSKPITPSDEMVEAAWNEVWDEVSMGLSRDDMRRAITAALNLMGGDK